MTGQASDYEVDGSEMVPVLETCVAHFLGGPLNGVRDPGFIWLEDYKHGNAHYNSTVDRWVDPHPDDPDQLPYMTGCDVYVIDVVKDKAGERLITGKWEGFVPVKEQ